jgi:hypothetical protein
MLKIAVGTAIGILMAVAIIAGGIVVWQQIPYKVSEDLRASIETQCANKVVNTTRWLANNYHFDGYKECVEAAVTWARSHKH